MYIAISTQPFDHCFSGFIILCQYIISHFVFACIEILFVEINYVLLIVQERMPLRGWAKNNSLILRIFGKSITFVTRKTA